jgi:hypothetical protein
MLRQTFRAWAKGSVATGLLLCVIAIMIWFYTGATPLQFVPPILGALFFGAALAISGIVSLAMSQ